MAPDPYAALKELKFKDWEEIYWSDEPGRSARMAILNVMFHLATTQSDWMGVHGYFATYNKRKAEFAVRQAMKLAMDFGDWYEIAVTTNHSSRTLARTFIELEKRARSFKQLLRLAQLLRADHADEGARRRVLTVLMRRAKTFEQWFEVWCQTEKFDPAVRDEVRKQLDAAATTQEQRDTIGRHEYVMAQTTRLLEAAIRESERTGENIR